MKVTLKVTGGGHAIEIRQVKYLNTIVEQDRRATKPINCPTLGSKAFHSPAASFAGFEVAHMIRKAISG